MCQVYPCQSLFCLESKIRHSTMAVLPSISRRLFCLESKIRHSTIVLQIEANYL